eukprot:4652354-Amphidinium_carterae.5
MEAQVDVCAACAVQALSCWRRPCCTGDTSDPLGQGHQPPLRSARRSQVSLDGPSPLSISQYDVCGPLTNSGRCRWWKVGELFGSTLQILQVCKPQMPERARPLDVNGGADDLIGALEQPLKKTKALTSKNIGQGWFANDL